MNKLTAEEVRLLIAGLSGNRTIREEKYLQALEIALPVLEQQESTTDTYRQIENDGWIEINGTVKNIPSDDDHLLVKYENGKTAKGKAKRFYWGIECESRIIAYRVIENDGRDA